MEQTKNEPTKENKAAPDTGKPKKGREPLTEAQRLKRQKMIVLPAMVLVFIGAMWLIFAPSSGKEQQPGTDGYNTEMPDADKANRQIIGDKLKAYEHGEMEERLESRNRAIGQLGDMFDREIAGPQFIAVSVLLFAYSTTLGWSHYGTRAVVYLLGERAAAGYKLVFAAMVLVGAGWGII